MPFFRNTQKKTFTADNNTLLSPNPLSSHKKKR